MDSHLRGSSDRNLGVHGEKVSERNRFRLEVVAFIFAIGVAWATLTLQVRAVGSNVDGISTHVSKMEKYLSSKDPQYWNKSGDQP